MNRSGSGRCLLSENARKTLIEMLFDPLASTLTFLKCLISVNSVPGSMPTKKPGRKKAMELIASAVAKVSLHEPLEENEVGVTPAVLVIGGGIAGIQASLDIAHSGFEVYLVEKSPTIGGHLSQLDRTFPNLEETSSILLPKMEEVANHPLIHLLTHSEVEEVEGFVGNFKVKIKHDPRYVSPEKCNRCKKCEEVCPVKVPSEFNMSLMERTAILSPLPQCDPLQLSH